jgi:2-polyprenyl-3-methyl-5-hydroxy-6-metoxy-1,4-benzoquinol methylase
MTVPEATAEWTRDELEDVGECPVCGGARSRELHSGLLDPTGAAAGSWCIRACNACGSGFLSPRPRQAVIDRAYEDTGYYTHGAIEPAQPAGAVGRLRGALKNGHLAERYGYELDSAARLGALLGRLFPSLVAASDAWVRHLPAQPGARLLDIGCGNGVFVERMCRLGWDAEGIDPDPHSVEVGRGAGRNVRLASAEELGELPAGSYAAITMSHVIEHFYSPSAVVAEARRLLADGGLLWVATPNIASLGHRRFGPHWRGLEVPRHLALFSTASLLDCLGSAGFADPVVLPPMPPNLWMLEESARSQLDAGGSARRRMARLWCRLAHRRARRRPHLSDELVVLARAA